MKSIQGPAIFLAQFASDEAPFDSIEGLAIWAADLGFKGVQIPAWDSRVFDLDAAADSKAWCEDYAGKLGEHGLVVTELATHIQGQLVASHPAYDEIYDAFTPEELRGNSAARSEWAAGEVKKCLTASKHFGLSAMATFSGSLAWPYFYPWPPRPEGLIEQAFDELARRWRPILDHAEDEGIDCAFELHPSEDLFDGATFERFLELTDDHARANILYDPSHFVLQSLDYLAFIDIYHERIRAFHVKDAEFRPDGRTGAYGGYLPWTERAGRFRSLGDGQVDFGGIFTALTRYGFPGWAVLEWECAYKDGGVGAREGAQFIKDHIIEVVQGSFDDFAATGIDKAANRRILGLDGPRTSQS